ncbi:alkaline phosphatase, partial [Clostridium sp.]|uniref:alkaline phosphatase n=1 Tax=Clostridium sp. TaxID=1506 RepID=UPI003F2E0995
SDKTTKVTTIAEQLKEKGYKVGVVSTVTLNHATPAAFYANVESRNNYYDIAVQMADSNFDYFAGGELGQPTGKNKDQRDIYEILNEKGYKVTRDKEEILSLNEESGKVYAINPELVDGAMEYDLDTDESSLKLRDLVTTGINVLNNDEGFFMMVESGKVDWAGHANDAMSNIQDVVEFDNAIAEAVKFYNEHPDETLIIVTGDHETGGMTLGQATTGYDTAFDLLSNQKMSYESFDKILKEFIEANPGATFDDAFSLVTENFGLLKEGAEDNQLVLNDYELNKLKKAYDESLKATDDRDTSIEAQILYGEYEPLTVTLTHILNNKAGIGWTSYSHTGLPVPVYAIGAGAEEFYGSYDNTDIYLKTAKLTGLK